MKFIRVVVGTSLIVGLGIAPASAAINIGSACKTVGQTVTSSKIGYECAGNSGESIWVKIPVAPKSLPIALSLLASWADSINSDQMVSYDTRISSKSDFQKALDLLDNSESEISQSLNEMVVNQTNLQNAISTANQDLTSYRSQLPNYQAQASSSQNQYQTLNSQLNIMGPDYQSAQTNVGYMIASQIICTFGYASCSPSNPYLEAQYRSTILAYESLKRQVDAAYSKYLADNNSLRMFSHQIDLSLQNIQASQAELSVVNTRIQVTNTYKSNVDASIDANNQALNAFVNIQNSYQTYQSFKDKLTREVGGTSISKLKNWGATYGRIAGDRFVFYAYRATLLNLVNGFSFSPSNFNMPAVDNWVPDGYLIASNYSDISVTNGKNFAWLWSKSSACSSVGISCVVAFVTSKEGCTSFQASVNWKDTNLKILSATITKLPAINSLAVVPVEFDVPTGLSNSSAYISSFMCS